jgi:hypothetical protein
MLFVCSIAFSIAAFAQTTAFTYQGRLTDGSNSMPSGAYLMKFTLHSADTGAGNQVGTDAINTNVSVVGGVFSVQLDFGSVFPGANRWLEVSVKKAEDAEYTTLTPRQQIASVPYSVRSLSATSTDSLSSACLGCVADSNINTVTGSKVTGSVANANNANTANSAVTAETATNATNAVNALTATTATTASSVSASAGDSVVSAVNASGAAVTTAHVAGDVELRPTSTQAVTQITGTTNNLIDTKLIGTDTLGLSGYSDLLSLGVSGTYHKFQDPNQPETRDMERFRVDNAGGVLAQGDLDIGTVMQEGAGVRMEFMPYKAAFRAGYVNGTQWDDANIGYYSFAFGNNARASGDNAFAAGQNTVAAGGNSTALGQFVTATGAASVALGYYAHTNSRQGSFVFSDRSIVDDGDIDTSEEDFKAYSNHSFNVRASGGYYLFTNSGEQTGLRMSSYLATGGTPDTSYGSFVWTDRSSNTSVSPTASNQTIFRSSGGYWLYSNAGLTAGVTVAPGGGAWSTISDRSMKENFQAVNSRDVLRRVLNLPISTWNYKAQNASIRHIGAMAQDFSAAFKVGENDTTISTIDPDGVALAAIQGLNEEMKDELKMRDSNIQQQQQQIGQQQQQLNALQQEVRQQQTVIEGMKKLLCQQNPEADVCKEK